MKTLISLVLAAALPCQASAVCAIANPTHAASARAVACMTLDKENAVPAFESYGYDNSALSKDYIRALLAQSNCAVLREDSPGSLQIKALGYDPVPTPSGWQKVVLITFLSKTNGPMSADIDDRYLTKECGTRTNGNTH